MTVSLFIICVNDNVCEVSERSVLVIASRGGFMGMNYIDVVL